MVLTDRAYKKRIAAQVTYDRSRGLFRLDFRALGTNCRVQFAATSRAAAAQFSDGAVEWVSTFEAKYSRFIDDSILSRINEYAGDDWVQVDAETEHLFALCDDLHFMTGGLLDPTTLPLIKLWDYRDEPDELPSEKAIEEELGRVGWSKVQRKPGKVFLPKKGMSLDFGGFGKEYAVDKVAALAVESGISACLVDFGQDIHALGTPPDAPAWHVGLEDPEKPGATWASVALAGKAVATSGDYLRYFEIDGVRYGHIIDPRTGKPIANGCLAVTVIAPSCLEAGVLSTAAYVSGHEAGSDLIELNYGAEGCFVSKSGIFQTSRFYEYVVSS